MSKKYADVTFIYDGLDGMESLDIGGNVSLLNSVLGTDRFWFVGETFNSENATISAMVTVYSSSGSSESNTIVLEGAGSFSSEPLNEFVGNADVSEIGAIEINFLVEDASSDSGMLALDRIVLGSSPSVPEPTTGVVALLGLGLCLLRRSR